MRRKKVNRFKQKLIVFTSVFFCIALMLWLYRETLRDKIIPEYGVELYDDEAIETGKSCKPAP